MNIKIDLVISASPELLNALSALVGSKPVAMPAPAPAPVVSIVPENGEVKKSRKKIVEELKQSEAISEPVTEPVKEETKTDLTQEMIIADAVPKSKTGHRDKIKAKVTELGYESITDLLPEHFDEFYAFLQTIPKP